MIGSHVIYGPFKFECSNGDCEYNVKAYDANGSQIHVGIYDSDGNSMTLDGYKKRSFYIRLSKENASRGVSRVTLEAKRTVTKMVSSYKKVKAWYVWKGATDSHGEPQPLYSDPISVSDVSRETSNSTHSINWEGCLPTGLVIDKYDQENPSKKLAGVKFRVSCKNPYYDQIWETDSDGHIEIYDLPIGNYKVEEVETIYGYKAEMKGKGSITSGMMAWFDFPNLSQTTNIGLGSPSKGKPGKFDSNTKEPLTGVSFKVQGEKGYLIAYSGGGPLSTVTGSVQLTNAQFTSDIDAATTFITDGGGNIAIYNIIKGPYYKFIEVSVGENTDYDVDDDYSSWESSEGSGPGCTVVVPAERMNSKYTSQVSPDHLNEGYEGNKRKYIKISGRVWEDVGWEAGKTSGSNNLFNDSENGGDSLDVNDQPLEGITVLLIGGSNGTKTTTTDAEGKYVFDDKILIDDIPKMHIEFEYNGMCYENIEPNLEAKNGSKAIEGSRRQEFNNNFSIITKGVSETSPGSPKYNLSYDTSEAHTSKLNYGGSYIWGYPANKESGKPVAGVDEQYMITASTSDAYGGNLDKIATPDDIRNKPIKEITDVNLGIRKRKDVDLSLMKDLESVRVNINGAEEHIYKYGERFNSNLFVDSEGNNGFKMEPGVKFGQESGRYGAMKYTRALYASDVYYDGRQGGPTLSVTVTYRIGIENVSDSLTATVNSIIDYYDEKYELLGVGSSVNSRGSVEGSSEQGTSSGGTDKYQSQIIPTNITVGPGEQQSIYVELQVKQSALDWLKNNEAVEVDNVAEIYSYSVTDGGGAYAAIDIDSQPGNAVPNDVNTYEDDTDKAPGLRLVKSKERKISGTVFFDEIENAPQLMTGQVRQANGIYDEGREHGISGVNVSLVKAGSDSPVQHCMGGNSWTDVTATTDENGNFTIEGFVPDEYELVYTWGDKTYKVQNYKSTIVGSSYDASGGNLEWYKNNSSQGSVAVDNYDTPQQWPKGSRQQIDEQSRLMKNNNKLTIDDAYEGKIELENGQKEDLITKIDAKTPRFKINIEYYGTSTIVGQNGETDGQGGPTIENNLRDIDLGIAERPKQAIELTKFIKDARITLANGTVLISAEVKDGKLTNEVNYAVYLPKINGESGQLKLEVDNEVIEGSKLSIEYGLQAKNISELDYQTKEFYTYGRGHGEDRNKLVTLNVEKVNDYVDESVYTEAEGSLLRTTEEKNRLIIDSLLENTEQMKEFLKDKGTVVLVSNELSKNLRPGDTAEMTFKVSRLLANTATEEISIENYAEIVQTNKSGGSTLQSIPGNYIPRVTGGETDDSEAETVTVIPPTGENLNYTPFVLIAIASLGVTSIGIILIKKYILE